MRMNEHNRLAAQPVGFVLKTDPPAPRPLEDVEESMLKGLSTRLDAKDIPGSALVQADNVDVSLSSWDRRLGKVALTPTKPNSNKVLLFETVQRNDASIVQLRFDEDKVYRRGAGSWTEITSGSPISGSSTDRFNLISINDTHVFANNGVNVLQEVNLTANTYAALGNAPRYKYITSCYNRIVGVYNTTTPAPFEVGWSGDGVFDEWDDTVDPSAGNLQLLEAPVNYSDFPTGLFTVSDRLLLLRERTVWLGSKQPIATNPFYFYPANTNFGCDIPYSASAVFNGVCFADRRTNNVYYCSVDANGGFQANPIATEVYPSLGLANIDPTTIFSGFDAYNLRYVLGIPVPASTSVILWTYDFKTGEWANDTVANASSISNVPFSAATFSIDDLVGTIDGLTGSIDGLSPSTFFPTNFIGLTNGDILQKSTNDTDNGTDYTFEIVSKNWEERIEYYVRRLVFNIRWTTVGELTLYYSIDGGNNWYEYKTVTSDITQLNTNRLIICTKNIKCREFCFKLVSTEGLFSISRFRIERDPGGPTRG